MMSIEFDWSVEPESYKRLETLISKEIKSGTFPGVEIIYAKGSKVLLHKAWGNLEFANSSPMLLDTVFDVASLTKPVVTTTLVMMLREKGMLNLDDLVQLHLPLFTGREKEQITLKHLMTHISGLPAWANLYESVENSEEARTRLLNIPLEFSPGEKMIYSCLGFLVLGEVLSKITGKSLSNLFHDKIAKPFKLHNSMFSPGKKLSDLSKIAPTENCTFRKKLLRGIVHDENSFAFEEEGGNAGLFSTAKDLLRFPQLLINEGELDGVRLLSKQSIAEILKNHNPVGLTPRGLGWEIKKPLSTADGASWEYSCGPDFPDNSFGHTGFTGTSLWFNPATKQIVIALSNRVNISRENNIDSIKRFRVNLHGLLITGR
ncbi:MAG: serine hydrolase [SAR324 cluster bacterium]|nr:serine hydrolase [SAR324 cluster bacterium]